MPDPVPQHVVFGYGSLINPASANRTLGRPHVPGPFPVAELRGYVRCWDAVIHTRRLEADDHDPARAVSLNITDQDAGPEPFCNGVLIAVTADELARFDEREVHYNRIEITGQVRATAGDIDLTQARVWTYVAKPEYRILPPGAFIAERYQQVVDEAVSAYGEAFSATFAKTTRPTDLPRRQAIYDNDPNR